MISMLRKNFGKRAVTVIAWVTVFSMGGIGLLGGLFKRFSGVPDTTVGTVNGYEIGLMEFQRKYLFYEHRIQMLRQRFGNAIDAELAKWGSTRDQALKELVMQKVLLSAADKAGLEIAPEYASKKLQDPLSLMQVAGEFMPAEMFTSKEAPNYTELLKKLQKQGISPQCFEALIEDRLKGNTVVDLAAAASYVPEEAVRDAFDAQFRGKKFEITKIPVNQYKEEAHKQGVSDAQLQEFFSQANTTARTYWSPEKRSGMLWTIEEPAADFVTQAENALDAGEESFADFLQKHAAVTSALGPVERRFDATTRRLYQLNIGAKAAFIEGKKGYIVELTGITPAAEIPLESIKARVQEDYYKDQAFTKLNQDLAHLQALSQADRALWIDQHKNTYGITQQITEFMTPDKPEAWQNLQKEGIATYDLMPMARIGQLKTGITNDFGYVAQVQEFEPLNQELFNQKKNELTQALARDARELVKAGFIASLEKNGKISTNNSFFNKKS